MGLWVLYIFLGLLLFFVLLLTVPVDLIFYVEKDVNFKSKIRVGWLFNLIGRDVKGKKKPEKEKPKKEKKKRKVKPFIAMLRARGFLRRLLKFITDVFRISHVRDFEADFRIGLSDPADTGMLFAVIAPAVVHLRAFTPLDVSVLPDFEQVGLQGYLKGALRIFPIQLVMVATLFAFSPATLRALKAMVLAWRK